MGIKSVCALSLVLQYYGQPPYLPPTHAPPVPPPPADKAKEDLSKDPKSDLKVSISISLCNLLQKRVLVQLGTTNISNELNDILLLITLGNVKSIGNWNHFAIIINLNDSP